MFENEEYCNDLAKYLVTIINSNNPFDKMLISKFLTLPRIGVRQGCKRVLPERFKVMKNKERFLVTLSDLVGWKYVNESWGVNFIGYRKWRKDYNGELESKLFSTGEINNFDRDQFINWLDHIPSQARFRVKCRVYYEDKNGKIRYPKLQKWVS